jgi:hypothetical protein
MEQNTELSEIARKLGRRGGQKQAEQLRKLTPQQRSDRMKAVRAGIKLKDRKVS